MYPLRALLCRLLHHNRVSPLQGIRRLSFFAASLLGLSAFPFPLPAFVSLPTFFSAFVADGRWSMIWSSLLNLLPLPILTNDRTWNSALLGVISGYWHWLSGSDGFPYFWPFYGVQPNFTLDWLVGWLTGWLADSWIGINCWSPS